MIIILLKKLTILRLGFNILIKMDDNDNNKKNVWNDKKNHEAPPFSSLCFKPIIYHYLFVWSYLNYLHNKWCKNTKEWINVFV